GRGRHELPAAASRGRRADRAVGAGTGPPGAPRPPYGRRARRDPRALPGTAWTAVLARCRL
ncbi:LOW QUALITY PROTEIN: conserved hypothetical protein, partial [Streptomyces sviceus ATCC 29083]